MNLTLYASHTTLVKDDGTPLPLSERHVVKWREKVSFEVLLPNNASFPPGYYRYAFDYDRDFMDTAPCNAGECTLVDGKLTFDVVFNSVRQAVATNGRRRPIPFYIQISTLEDDFSEYVIDDAIWVNGCVWDGRAAPAVPATNYYTKEELDALVAGKLDTPVEPGEVGYVLGIAEDGSFAWIPQAATNVSWGNITDKPNFKTVATTGDYNDLSNKPSIPAAQVQSDWDESDNTKADYIKNKPTFATVATTGNYNDLGNKPTIPAAQVQADWDQTNTSAKDYIKNKPTIPASQVQSDWDEADNTKADFIKNKPALKTVATTGSYNDLTNKPTIPTSSDYIPQSEKNAANGVPQLDGNAMVPVAKLPVAVKGGDKGILTIASAAASSGLNLSNGLLNVATAGKAAIDAHNGGAQPIGTGNLLYAVRSVLPKVTTIPAATTAYSLLDASATTNDHSMAYEHAPTSAPTYTLPAVSDATIAHSIILDVDFTTVQTCSFVDSDGYTLITQKEITIQAGDRYRFICIYQYGTWLIYPLQLKAETVTPTTPVSITGDTATAISVQLSATASGNGILTYSATGLPAGVTCSSSGLISGTPTTAGTTEATVTVKTPYSKPATIVVNFTIAQGSGVPQSLTVSGTGAQSNNFDGAYTLTNDTVNSRPVWYNSANQKYIFAVENGMDNGWFAWAVGGTPVQMSAGDTMMFYTYCTYDVQGLANLSDTPDQSTTPWYSMGTEVSSSEFSIAVTA